MAQGSPSNSDGWLHPNLVRDAYGFIKPPEEEGQSHRDAAFRTPYSVSQMPFGHIQKLKEFQALQARRAMEVMLYGMPISKPGGRASENGNQELGEQ
ncbi:MAG: hypothetical protein O3B01_13830 [Planctomycetota bacterium]|nr:hypothetical protein [Planctomycetota bacterium]MDA1139648.1 hypothetical protein [Planctomycetota bacterium]